VHQHLIIEPNAPGDIDLEVFHRDMMALQFIMGEPIQCPMMYGIRGADAVACVGTSYHKNVPGSRTPAINDDLEDFEFWIEPFFYKLSVDFAPWAGVESSEEAGSEPPASSRGETRSSPAG
jgi:hypothetical protein